MLLRFSVVPLLFLLSGCEQKSSKTSLPAIQIFSRDEHLQKPFPLYKFTPPALWSRVDSGKPASADTTEALAYFQLKKEQKQLDLTLHNFPFDHLSQTIPPEAQIARWKKQFEQLQEVNVAIKPQAFGGFVGLRFEAIGEREGKPFALLAWSMQLAPTFFTALELRDTPSTHGETRQMHADFTIKASGDPVLLKSERQAIIDSARSFALIEELPSHF